MSVSLVLSNIGTRFGKKLPRISVTALLRNDDHKVYIYSFFAGHHPTNMFTLHYSSLFSYDDKWQPHQKKWWWAWVEKVRGEKKKYDVWNLKGKKSSIDLLNMAIRKTKTIIGCLLRKVFSFPDSLDCQHIFLVKSEDIDISCLELPILLWKSFWMTTNLLSPAWPSPLWYPTIWIGRLAGIEILFIFFLLFQTADDLFLKIEANKIHVWGEL